MVKTEKFHEFLRAKRVERQIPLKRICWLTGVVVTDYARVELGLARPDDKQVDAIVKHFGLSSADNVKLQRLAMKIGKRWKPVVLEDAPEILKNTDERYFMQKELEPLFEYFDKKDLGDEKEKERG